MTKSSISYVVNMPNLKIEILELSIDNPSVSKTVIKNMTEGVISVDFYMEDVFSIEKAMEIINPILEKILDLIAFEYCVEVGIPVYVGATIPQENSEKNMAIVTHCSIYDSLESSIYLGKSSIEKLKDKLEKLPQTSSYHYSAFRFCMNQKDLVARYMFLYNILLSLNNDKQKNVDIFIHKELPEIDCTPIPKKPNKKETVFTRLRNEVAHSRENTVPTKICKEISENIYQLQDIVKKAISQIT